MNVLDELRMIRDGRQLNSASIQDIAEAAFDEIEQYRKALEKIADMPAMMNGIAQQTEAMRVLQELQ